MLTGGYKCINNKCRQQDTPYMVWFGEVWYNLLRGHLWVAKRGIWGNVSGCRTSRTICEERVLVAISSK